ncbi:calpain 7 [Actinomortierella ambigua]|nr:calpain 7 [Actinomortierella ambigua]
MNSPPSPSSQTSSGPKTPGDDPDGFPIDSSNGPGPTAPTATGYPVGSMLTDSTLPDLYSEAYNLALQAVTEDGAGDPHTARILYCEACEPSVSPHLTGLYLYILMRISETVAKSIDEFSAVVYFRDRIVLPHGDELQGVERKSHQYMMRAGSLSHARDASEAVHEVKEISKLEMLVQEAQFAYDQGVAESEKQREQGALDFFTESADLYWQAWKEAPEGAEKDALKETLNKVMVMAEDIKGISAHAHPPQKSKAGATIVSGPSNLTPQELAVLKKTMIINNKVYHPWSDTDVRDLFLRDKGPFVDPDGMLPLSEKQLAKFGAWKRASQICENPKMICLISSTSIVQDLVTDCSFVASLCVSASYERRWKKQLIRACIYPKNKFGEPCYNPNGKYLVKLTFNGIPRRVVRTCISAERGTSIATTGRSLSSPLNSRQGGHESWSKKDWRIESVAQRTL